MVSIEELRVLFQNFQNEVLEFNWEKFWLMGHSISQLHLVILGLFMIIPFIVLIVRRFKPEAGEKIGSKMMAVKDFVAPGEGPRFRKRDRLAFMGRRVFRNAKAVGSLIRGGQGRKRRAMAKLVRRVFQRGSPDTQSQTLMPDLPEEFYLEEDVSESGSIGRGENEIPRALYLVLKSLRVFGHVDFSLFVELMKDIQYVTLRPNEYLFKIGEPDENMYIVDSGRLNVFRTSEEPSGQATTCLLKQVGQGEAIFSLLSFIEHMGGLHKKYKTVSAKAVEESRVVIVSFNSFKTAFATHPEHLTKVVQVVMVRLQRVTFLALHQYLGLGAELLTSVSRGVQCQNASRKTSGQDSHSSEHYSEAKEKGQVPISRHSNEQDSASGLSTSAPSTVAESSLSFKASTPEEEPSTSKLGESREKGATTSKMIITRQQSDAGPMSLSNSSLKRILCAKKTMNEMDRPSIRQMARDIFQEVLDLSDDQVKEMGEHYFTESVTVSSWDERDVILEEGSGDNPGLLLVLQGSVYLSQKDSETQEEKKIQKILTGGFLCQLQTLTDEPSFFTVTSLQNNCQVASLDAKYVRQCMNLFPQVTLKLAMSVIEQLSPYVRSIDFALEWLQLESGRALYRQNEFSDSTYVVLSGRLRSVIQRTKNKREFVAECGRGDLIGIVETLMKSPRTTTVLAVRDSEIAKIPAGLIDSIKMQYPRVMLRLLNLLGQKLQQSWKRPDADTFVAQTPTCGPLQVSPLYSTQTLSNSNFTTVAIFALAPEIPKSSFALELLHALIRNDPALRLTKDYILDELGSNAFSKTSDFRLSEWLATQEDKHRIVLYECDNTLNHWTKLCIRHADVIFILADPKGDSEVSQLEHDMELVARRTRKELIFLHTEDTKYPSETAKWLRNRNWINAHYHVKCPRRMFSKKTDYSRILNGQPPDVHSDFCRLGRMLTGTSVGLVLGGGGARGCAHVGMIKAIIEAGIPIDHVAGVSIGSYIGALYSVERDLTEVTVKVRDFSETITVKWRLALDITYPYVAYFTGRRFNHVIEKHLKDFDILDTWLPYFTLTTDITAMAQRVHDYGSLWRYVRSSMSLANYLPPLCDPHDGHLLLDGGYVNNLPADVMRSRGARYILAVDVGAEDNSTFTNYGDSLNGFSVLVSRLPFFKTIHVPDNFEVQLRLAYVSCVGKLEAVKTSGYCEYIRPPIDKYGTLQFDLFDEIKEVGYKHGTTFFQGYKKAGLFQNFSGKKRGSLDDGGIGSLMSSNNSSPQRRTFSEMAKVVCSVTSKVNDDDEDTEDDFQNYQGHFIPSDAEDIDDETLISDEEDDNESGFLSQK